MSSTEVILDTPAEAGLARLLLRLPEVLEDLESELTPHRYDGHTHTHIYCVG